MGEVLRTNTLRRKRDHPLGLVRRVDRRVRQRARKTPRQACRARSNFEDGVNRRRGIVDKRKHKLPENLRSRSGLRPRLHARSGAKRLAACIEVVVAQNAAHLHGGTIFLRCKQRSAGARGAPRSLLFRSLGWPSAKRWRLRTFAIGSRVGWTIQSAVSFHLGAGVSQPVRFGEVDLTDSRTRNSRNRSAIGVHPTHRLSAHAALTRLQGCLRAGMK